MYRHYVINNRVDYLFFHEKYCIVLYVSETIVFTYISQRIKFKSYSLPLEYIETYFSSIIELDGLIMKFDL